MSEQLRHNPENHVESIDTNHESEKNLQRLREAAKNTPETSIEAIDASLSKAKEEAVSGHEVTIGERESPNQGHSPGLQKELKAESYRRTMKRIQSTLPAFDKTFSKIIHQPTVDAVSNVAGRTVARPSGILGGSIAALIGSVALLYFARHYGFTYNYLFFSILFVVGFVFGTVAEGIIRLVRKP